MDSLPPIFPGRVGRAITIFQIISLFLNYKNETNPATRTQYSKFSQASSVESSQTKKASKLAISSKLAMLVIYFPSLLVSIVLLVLGSNTDTSNDLSFNVPQPSIAAFLCATHFFKRVAEVLFLHRYSGKTDIGTPCFISIFYSLITTMVAYAGSMSAPLAPGVFKGNLNARDVIGVSVFLVGILGNFYHHYLLAKLRCSKQNKSVANDMTAKRYIAPKGGLFKYCAAPHYFFELIGWAGVAIVSDHLNVYLAMANMTSYLAGRSVAQNDFNRTRFKEKDWPRDRKNLVPFVF